MGPRDRVVEAFHQREELGGVGQTLVEGVWFGDAVEAIKQHVGQGPRVVEPSCHRQRLVGQLQSALPVATVEQLQGQSGEQPSPLRAVDVPHRIDRRLEDGHPFAIHHADGAWEEASPVDEGRLGQSLSVATLLGQAGGVEERLPVSRVAGPPLRLAE